MLNVTEQRQIICFIVLSILKGNFESESTADRCATKILTMFEEISNQDFSLISGLIKHHYLILFRVCRGKSPFRTIIETIIQNLRYNLHDTSMWFELGFW